MINKLKQKYKSALKKIKWKFKLKFSKKIYVSFGENCLPDNILERHKLKSLTSPYSHGRTNIEYILLLERDNYKDFLNPDYLKYEMVDGKKIAPRLKKYTEITNKYNQAQMNGFEFTHHDVIKSINLRKKFEERVKKIQSFIGQKKYIILYHHRYNKNTNLEQLILNLKELKELYSGNKNLAEVICFTQNIVETPNERNVEFFNREGIHLIKFNTLNLWEGENDDIFWARTDEDLIIKMIDYLKKI